MRVLLFTDTLVDVNGVSRFITNLREHSLTRGRSLTVVCCTKRELASRRGLVNLPCALRLPMPGYTELELTLPYWGEAMALAKSLQPDVIHVSTPGPVGLCGRRVARRLGIPLAGVYHTDFTRYAHHLFADPAATYVMERALRWFYGPFDRIITRSSAYTAELAAAGVPAARLRTLDAGVDSVQFSPSHRDEVAFASIAGRQVPGVRVVYCGRVSVEKNLELLTSVWPGVARAARTHGVLATLIVIGQGPMLDDMRQALHGHDAIFLGYRTGNELSTIYASGDFLVFPSATDTLGQAVLEAQASGMPALVSDRGGPRTAIVDGVTGVVIPSSSARHWHNAILGMIINTERRHAMARSALAHARALTIERSLDHWWTLHEALLEEKQ
jgi:glycosyltransferase involved in cell wall biosynthesis